MGRNRLAQGLITALLLLLVLSSILLLFLFQDNSSSQIWAVQKEEYRRYIGKVNNNKGSVFNVKDKSDVDKELLGINWEDDLRKLVELYENGLEPNLENDNIITQPLALKAKVESVPEKVISTFSPVKDITSSLSSSFNFTQKPTRKRKVSNANPGILNVHIWESWCGSRIEDLKRNKHFPFYPTFKANLTRFFAQWFETGYGERIFGYLHPPETGNYTFAISCDDNCEVWLSNTSDPGLAKKIASVGTFDKPSNTRVADFRVHKSQISKVIFLRKDEKYFIEALHKQAAYKDHILVTWLAPSWPRIKTISAEYISSFIDDNGSISDVNDYVDYIPETRACKQTEGVFKEGSIYFFNRTAHKFGSENQDFFHLFESPSDDEFQDLLPKIAYQPSYVVDFEPKRYEGVKLIHESSIYPDDYTELSHMLNYERCNIHRTYDSHLNLLRKDSLKSSTFTDNDWFQSSYYKLKEQYKYDRPRSSNTLKEYKLSKYISKAKVKNTNTYNEIYLNTLQASDINGDSTVTKNTGVTHRSYDDFTPTESIVPKMSSSKDEVTKSLKPIRADVDIPKKGSLTNSTVAVTKVSLFQTEDISDIESNHKLSKVNLPKIPKTDNMSDINKHGRKLLSLDSFQKPLISDSHDQLKRNVIKRNIFQKHSGGILKDSSVPHRIDDNVKNYYNTSYKGNIDKKMKFSETANLGEGYAPNVETFLNNKKSFALSKRLQDIEQKLLKRRNQNQFIGNTGKTWISRDDVSPLNTPSSSLDSYDADSRLRASNEYDTHTLPKYSYSTYNGLNNGRFFSPRIPPRLKKKIFFKDGIPSEKGFTMNRNLHMIQMYDVFGAASFFLNRQLERGRAWIYKSLLSDCKSDGNLRLSEQVAKSVVRKYMEAIRRKHGSKYTLKKIIGVEENHDVIKGNRYLIELELKVKGNVKPIRVSKYVYQEVSSTELSYPMDFQWDPKAMVHIIVPVKDQGRWVQHFIKNMEEIYLETRDENLNIIIVDFDSSDINIKLSLENSKLKKYELVRLNGPFQRAYGLQAGANTIKNERDIIFTCDLHLQIPSALIDSLRKHTIYRKMAFAPMVYRLSCGYTPELPYGLWEIQGYGLFSITKHDYDRIGGMNTEEFKTKWGGEDWEFLDRTLAHGIEVERLRVPNFYHFYHSKKRMWVTPATTTSPLKDGEYNIKTAQNV